MGATGLQPAAQFARARQLCAAGNLIAAERACRELLAQQPGQPQAGLLLGETLSAQGRHRDAIAALAPIVEIWPNAGAAHFCLGNAFHAAGRHADAARQLRRATELQPHFAGGWCNLGLALDRLGDRDGAIAAYERALLLQPDLAAAQANLGSALLHAGQPVDAVLHLRRAAALEPGRADNHFLLGIALWRAGGLGEAASALRAALAHRPDFGQAWYALAGVLSDDDQAVAALPYYQRAVALEPGFAAGWVGLGSALRSLGRFAEAEAAYERALRLEPRLGAAHRAVATIRRRAADTAELDRLRALLDDPAGDREDRGAAGLAMAKILDDSGDYDAGFAVAAAANRLLRGVQLAAGIRYDHAAFRAENDARNLELSPSFLAATRGWGNPSELPVFIVGCFRTGTTLVEQICASHSQVHGAGELRDIPQIWAQLQQIAPQPQHWTKGLIARFAEPHLARLMRLAPGKSRIVDKMPDNIYLLGLIALLFPGARIVFCHRDGRDAALSIFLQRFARQVAFATDLVDAGRRWHEAERIAAWWADRLPLRAHHVHYETLIGDFDGEARRLVAFLGLDWEPGCRDFHKTQRAVRTASTWQVRQPLYESSVGRWRHYKRHLAPLCAAIGVDLEAPTGSGPADLA